MEQSKRRRFLEKLQVRNTTKKTRATDKTRKKVEKYKTKKTRAIK